MTTHKLMIAGFGGQGILMMGQLIAYAAMFEDKEVTWIPSYGPEMRGGTANCSVIVSDKKISSPVIVEATTAAVMNQPSLTRFEPFLRPGGQLFINTSLIKNLPNRNDLEIYQIDANGIAAGLGADKAANIVMLGAIINKTDIVKPESVITAMEKLMKGRKEELLPINKKALTAWQSTDHSFGAAKQ